jgi:hypothetical protein
MKKIKTIFHFDLLVVILIVSIAIFLGSHGKQIVKAATPFLPFCDCTQLTGIIPSDVKNHKVTLVGHHKSTDKIHLVIGLAIRDKQKMDEILKSGKILTQEEANQLFNPTPIQEQQVIEWASSYGFSVTNSYVNHIMVDVEGTFGQAEQMLHVHINDYKKDGRVLYAPAEEPSIKKSLHGIVDTIVGLDNFTYIFTIPPRRTPQILKK